MTRLAFPRRYVPHVAVLALGLALVAAATVLTPGRPPAASDQPLSDDTVVATLQTDGRRVSPDLKAALRASRATPGDLPLAKAAARLLIDEGRAAGDSRLVGAALGILRPFIAAPDAETLYLSAVARQYQHDFPGALALLDDAIRRDPGDVNAVLTRATIQTVLGRFDLASADCQRLSALSRPDIGFLCQSTALLLTADAPRIQDRLDAILSQPGVLDPSLQGWARGLQAEIAALQGQTAKAQTLLAQVIADDPLALRERLLLADLLLADGKATEVMALLAPAAPVDGVLIRRLLASDLLGNPVVDLRADLEARFQRNIDLGLTAHAREETLYYLRIAKDSVRALDRAQVNWALQHEIEDAQLLVDAAVFAGNPAAAVPVVRWMAEQSVVVPAFRLPDAVREAAQ